MTPDLENEIKVMKLRSHLDPKRFYAASARILENDVDGVRSDGKKCKSKQRFFQVGTVIEGRFEAKRAHRISKKNRKATFVDQVLADSEAMGYTKKVYEKRQDRGQSGTAREYLRRRNSAKKKGWQRE